MNKYVVKNQVGGHFVSGRGFTGTSAIATVFTCRDEADKVVECAANMGISATVVELACANANIVQNPDGSSYGVCFIREKDIQRDGSVSRNRNNPSPRRFKTEGEANHHGARFVKIEKHRGFYVVKTFDAVNAWINQVTGKTNPEIGRARTNR